jgi:hypothetical protein
MHEGLSRTNNSLEGFFRIWNSYLALALKPRLSVFMRRVRREFSRWQNIVIDFQQNPADGIRGGLTRRRKWIRQDQNFDLLQ